MPVNNSPNMNMPIPAVGEEPGPDYAIDVNNSLTIVDGHTHSPGSGVQITPSGINISSDLTFSSNNALSLRTAKFTPQSAPLALAGDIGCIYVSGVDLYFNDVNGNQIAITNAGSVAGTSGSIANLVAPASATYVAIGTTFVWQSNVNTPANMDGASYLLRNLAANSKALTLSPPAAMGADYTITLPSLPAANNTFLTISTSGNIASAVTVDNVTLEIATNLIQIKDSGVSTAKIANSAVTTAKIADANVTNAKMATNSVGTTNLIDGSVTKAKQSALGQVASSSSGAFTTSSAGFVNITNLSCTITTTGRPVFILLKSDGTGNNSFIGPAATANTQNAIARFKLLRDGTEVYRTQVQGTTTEPGGAGGQIGIPPGALFHLDGGVGGAGTYTYVLQTQIGGSATTSHCEFCQLTVWEA